MDRVSSKKIQHTASKNNLTKKKISLKKNSFHFLVEWEKYKVHIEKVKTKIVKKKVLLLVYREKKFDLLSKSLIFYLKKNIKNN